MRASRAIFAFALAPALAFPAAAPATWSDVQKVPLSAEAMWPAAAVNARGDAAVAWIQEGRSGGHATLRVRAAIRRAGAARFSVHTLVARRDLAARGAAVALDARGELTVAWVEQPSDNGRTHGSKTVRAAHRTPGGRWSAVQAIGRSSAFNGAAPRLAATAGGTVVLTYNTRTRGTPGVQAAWRSRGRAFGSLQSVPTDHLYLTNPTLAIDPEGRVFLTGTRGCDQPGGTVMVAIAPPGRRRFTSRTTVVTATPGKDVRLAVVGPRTVALSWLSGKCATAEPGGGVPYAATVRDGVAAQPVALGTVAAMTIVATPAPGGADVSFAEISSTTPMGRLMTSRIAADGTIGAPGEAADGWVALAGDPAGDQLVGHPGQMGTPTTPLAARSAAGVIEPAPLASVGFPWTSGTLAARDGRALAVLSFRPLSSMTPSIVMAVWRP